jgi:hypothetical protein
MKARQMRTETPRWGDDELTEQLLHQLNKDHIGAETIQRMVRAAGGKKSLVPLLGHIASGEEPGESWYEQANAIYVLGMMKDPAAIPWLTHLLGTADIDLQILAVRALGRIGGDQALEPVRRLYNAPQTVEKKIEPPAANGAGHTPAVPCPVPPALALEMRQVLDQAGQPPAPLRTGRQPRSDD